LLRKNLLQNQRKKKTQKLSKFLKRNLIMLRVLMENKMRRKKVKRAKKVQKLQLLKNLKLKMKKTKKNKKMKINLVKANSKIKKHGYYNLIRVFYCKFIIYKFSLK